MPSGPRTPWHALGQASMAGVTLAACIFVGVGLGLLLDQWWRTAPWMFFTGMLFGIVAGFYNVVRILASLQKPPRP